MDERPVMFRRRGDVLGRRTLDGLLLWAPEWAEPLHLRHPAYEAWMLLETAVSPQQLVEDLAFVFDAEATAAESELLGLLDDLQERGAVVAAEPPAS